MPLTNLRSHIRWYALEYCVLLSRKHTGIGATPSQWLGEFTSTNAPIVFFRNRRIPQVIEQGFLIQLGLQNQNPRALRSRCQWWQLPIDDSVNIRSPNWAFCAVLVPPNLQDTLTLSPCIIGTTISLLLLLSHAIWPGNASTSGTSCVTLVAAAVPHTPFPKAMVWHAMCPWKGPSINWPGFFGSRT